MSDMKLGIEIDWQSRHFHVPLERLRLADKLGYDMVFTAEANGSDAISPLGYILGVTERIGVGTHIAQTIGRSPAALATTRRSLPRKMVPRPPPTSARSRPRSRPMRRSSPPSVSPSSRPGMAR